jgi:hypothetical protein
MFKHSLDFATYWTIIRHIQRAEHNLKLFYILKISLKMILTVDFENHIPKEFSSELLNSLVMILIFE